MTIFIPNQHRRLYSIFEKRNGRWVRISPLAYAKADAVHVFQTALLDHGVLAGKVRELRPVRGEGYDHG
jgi:hypothetical protein